MSSQTAAGDQCGVRWGGVSRGDACPDNWYLPNKPHVCRCVIIFTMEEYSELLRTGNKTERLGVMGDAKRARHRDHECSCTAKPGPEDWRTTA